MPLASKRPCTAPACGALVSGGGACPKHAKARESARGSARARGYDTRWEKARAGYLAKHATCARCPAPATVVDHIRPHRGDQVLFWDSSNWQPLCKRCHDTKTATEDGGFGHARRLPTDRVVSSDYRKDLTSKA